MWRSMSMVVVMTLVAGCSSPSPTPEPSVSPAPTLGASTVSWCYQVENVGSLLSAIWKLGLADKMAGVVDLAITPEGPSPYAVAQQLNMWRRLQPATFDRACKAAFDGAWHLPKPTSTRNPLASPSGPSPIVQTR
jgi:hypothetical protein